MNYSILCKEWDLPTDISFVEYIAGVIKNSTTPNGVCGMKVQWDQIERIRKMMNMGVMGDRKTLDILFPMAKFIFLTRQDFRAQAISYYRAAATNEWWRKHDVVNTQTVAPDPPYNSEKIRFLEQYFAKLQNKWEKYFRVRNIEPLHVEYATLEKDCHGETARCLNYLGLDPTAIDSRFQTTFVRQADALTRAWKKRLDEEDARKE
jgi:LPS sulfotransferase NodH